MAKREGSCLRCGKCCRWLGWLAIPDDHDFIEWLKARESGVLIKEDPNNPGELIALIPHICQHLHWEAGGRYTCKLYGKPERPKMCQREPETPYEEVEGCGFYFVEGEIE
jgi:hypothetical protein